MSCIANLGRKKLQLEEIASTMAAIESLERV